MSFLVMILKRLPCTLPFTPRGKKKQNMTGQESAQRTALQQVKLLNLVNEGFRSLHFVTDKTAQAILSLLNLDSSRSR